jgi:hypothetical protein
LLEARVRELEKDKERLDWLNATDYETDYEADHEGEARIALVGRTFWRRDTGGIRAAIDAAKGE